MTKARGEHRSLRGGCCSKSDWCDCMVDSHIKDLSSDGILVGREGQRGCCCYGRGYDRCSNRGCNGCCGGGG